MKKGIFILLICLLFIGCKKDGTTSANSIVGTWQFVSEVDYTNGSAISTSIPAGNTSTFNSNGTGNYTTNGKIQNITYSLNGSNITFEIISVSGNETLSGIIKILNSNTLDIHWDYIGTSAVSRDDIYSR